MFDISGKVVCITGGCGLLGKSIVLNLLKLNSIPIILDIDKQVFEQFSSQHEIFMKSEFDFFSCNITSERSIKDSIDKIYCKYGVIHSLINSAYPRNKNYGKPLFDVEYPDFCENVSMHLGGYFLTSKLFSQFFIKQGYGNIVNIASIYGCVAPKFDLYAETNFTMPVEYSVIKSGLIHMTKYFSAFLKGKDIRVNCVSPGGLEAGQPEVFLKKYKRQCLNKGMLDPNDVVGSVLFLVSDASKYINGQNIIVDDGFVL